MPNLAHFSGGGDTPPVEAGASGLQARQPTDIVVRQPRVWLLMGHKAGDNAQVMALAAGLGWPFEVKRLVYRRWELLTNLLLGPNLAGVARGVSSPLQPPWPDLVISAGRRNEPVARWIRRQTGGRARLVHLGRPWARLDRFDLIVTTPQYQLPERHNVLLNELPLHGVTAERLAEAAAVWAPRLRHLRQPYIAVLLGGNSPPYVFDEEKGRRLARQASAMARSAGGSLLVTTSARTPQPAAEAFIEALEAPAHVFRWSPAGCDNPYRGYLALADAFIVTGDSVSMLAEACATRKPVYIFDPSHPGGVASGSRTRRPLRFGVLVHRLATRYGPRRMRRSVRAIHLGLIHAGRATWLGEPASVQPIMAPLHDLERAVTRVRELFEANGTTRGG